MSPISKISLPLILLLYAPVQVAAQTKVERIDEVVRYYHERGYFNGAVLVGEKGRIIYEKGAGEADFTSHAPNTPQTRYGIGSITFTLADCPSRFVSVADYRALASGAAAKKIS
jgi:CubicO group peptidase (beta-lactamase class C family)